VGYLRHTNAGGASTIPEQLAKISFLQDNGSLAYKIKEIILGTELVNDFSKDQILDMYLNRIPYGNQAIGIQTAAELYFHEPASALDLAQSAMLAGLPQAPSEFDPDVNPGGAKQRQGAVLQAMVGWEASPRPSRRGSRRAAQVLHVGAVPSADHHQRGQHHQLPQLPHRLLPPQPLQWRRLRGPRRLRHLHHPQPQGSGHRRLDGAQRDHVQPGVVRDQGKGGDGALVSLDPQTGAVLAMTGSANYASPVYGQDNLAIDERQPGSTMKLFTYTDAIASRQYTMTTQVSDETMTINGWTPKDYEGSSAGYGFCEMEYCLGNSLNLPAVRTEYALGVLPIANLAVDAG